MIVLVHAATISRYRFDLSVTHFGVFPHIHWRTLRQDNNNLFSFDHFCCYLLATVS